MIPSWSPPLAMHVRRRRAPRLRSVLAVAVAGLAIVASTSALTSAVSGPPVAVDAAAGGDGVARFAQVQPVPFSSPTPEETLAPPTAPADLCADPSFATALATGDDVAAIAVAGGGESFRSKVAGGMAPCVSLSDPTRIWVVIDKVRPIVPLEFQPADLLGVQEMPLGNPEASLRADAALALSAMAAAALAAGAGQLGIESGYRSFWTQQTTYGNQVATYGVEKADLGSARPGFSEHQSGLAADVMPCDAGCRSIDAVAGSTQGDWILAHAWEYGWIVRYDAVGVGATGYEPEPWHLRYVGVELARAYAEGEWHSLEEFFGLPPAPGYLQ